MRYRIYWVSTATQFNGHGSWLHWDPTEYVEEMNRQFAGIIQHYVERS
jgi:hypothetical protein